MANVQRGTTRSGKVYKKLNKPTYTSVGELLYRHKRLLDETPAITARAVRIAGVTTGSLEQTTVRFKFGYQNIRPVLTRQFLELFREHSESSREGFEVVVTFNAILQELDSRTFSLFYGQDHRVDNRNVVGAAKELRYGNTIVVKSVVDVQNIPISFDSDQLIASHRHAFEHSNVRIHSFLNVIYLIYRFCETKKRHGKYDEGDEREQRSRSDK